MSDEQTIYISPDDDLTTVRERLEQIPARKITLVIPSQTQLRSQTVWKILNGDVRRLNKEVVIVSSDPQVRSVAHAGKFRVAHSLESISNSGSSRPGSSATTGRSASRARSVVPPSTSKMQTTMAKEPTSRRGGSRPSRSTRVPSAGQTPTWLEPDSFRLPEPPDSRSSQFDDPHTAKPPVSGPSRLNLPGRSERREEQSSPQIYEFHSEPLPPLHPLPFNQIEESDPLSYTPIDREDYEKARDILQAATGSHPDIQQSEDAEQVFPLYDDVPTSVLGTDASPAPANQFDQPETGVSPAPTEQFDRPISPVYGEDDPFIYMQDDSQLPPQSEQKGDAILQDDEISAEYPSLQKPEISDLPTHVIESQIEYRGDNDDDVIMFPTSAQARAQVEDDEVVEKRPSHLSSLPSNVSPATDRADILPRPGQSRDEEEDRLPPIPERSVPTHEPQPIPLPTPRAQSKPLPPPAKPLPPRTGGPGQPQVPIQMSAPTQMPGTDSRARNGSRVAPARGTRPTPQPTRPRGGSAVQRGSVSTRQSATRNRSRRPPTRLYLVLASLVALLALLFAVLYLNMASTVTLTVTTQNYSSPISFTLSDHHLSNAVPAKLLTHTFTKTAPEPATGSTMQATNYAQGFVSFTNTGTTNVQIPSQTILTTANNIEFVTTANILAYSPNANATPVLDPIRAVNPGIAGNVPAGTVVVIPPSSLSSIAQAQTSVVSADSLKTTLTVSNSAATSGGEAHQISAVAQQDLDNAKKDLDTQVQPDINAWQQQNADKALVGQPVVTNDTLVNPAAVDTPAPDKTFSASISVTVTMLVAQLGDAQRVAVGQLNNAVHADKQFGPTFVIIGDWQTISINLAQQKASDGTTVTVPVQGKVGPNLHKADLQNSIKGKSPIDARVLLRQKDRRIQQVDIQTQPGFFWWVSPWTDHINVIVRSST